MEAKLTKVALLLDELARSPHEPADYDLPNAESVTARLPARCLVRVFDCLAAAAVVRGRAVCRRWRAVAVSPWLWHRKALDASARLGLRAEAEALRRRAIFDAVDVEVGAFELSREALATVPARSVKQLRDALAAAARKCAPQPLAAEAAVLDACCTVVGRPWGSCAAYRAALDGDARSCHPRRPAAPAKAAEAPPGAVATGGGDKLVFALRRLDVGAALFEGRDGRSTVESRRITALVGVVRADCFAKNPRQLAARNLLLGRLAAYCIALARLVEAVVGRVRGDAAESTPEAAEAAEAICRLGEFAAQKWLGLCVRKQPERRRAPSLGSTRRSPPKRRTASLPPQSPTLYTIFQAERKAFRATTAKAIIAPNDCGETLRRFYLKYNPALADQAPAIAREWRGAETTLFALLRYKYRRSDAGRPAELEGALDAADTATTPPDAGGGAAAPPWDDSIVGTTAARPWEDSFVVRAVAPSPQKGPRQAAIALLRQEIDRLKTTVESATTEAGCLRASAAVALADAALARRALELGHESSEAAAAVLRADADALRLERDARDEELAALRRELERLGSERGSEGPTSYIGDLDLDDHDVVPHRRGTRTGSCTPPCSPPEADSAEPAAQPQTAARSPDQAPSADACEGAVDAVTQAIIDVLLTETAIEIDFEIEFDLTPPPDLPPPPPAEPRAASPPRPPPLAVDRAARRGAPVASQTGRFGRLVDWAGAARTRSASPSCVMPLALLEDFGGEAEAEEEGSVSSPGPRTRSLKTASPHRRGAT